jgi:hypothetical protein
VVRPGLDMVDLVEWWTNVDQMDRPKKNIIFLFRNHGILSINISLLDAHESVVKFLGCEKSYV